MAIPSSQVDTSGASPGRFTDVLGGMAGSLAVLAVPLSLGLLAFSPLGAGAASVGLLAAFVTAAGGGLFHALLSRSSTPAAGPSSATALVLASLVASLLADPRLHAGGRIDLPLLLAGCAMAVLLSGLLQLLLAAGGLARLARGVPRPVLAGFMNGVALLIVISQLPLLLGLPPGSPVDAAALAAAWDRPGAPLLCLGTVALILLLQRLRPRWPAALLALVVATVLVQALLRLLPAPELGPLVGPLPAFRPDLGHLLAMGSPRGLALWVDHGHAIAATAVVLALIGSLESLLSHAALDEVTGGRHDPRHELLVLGATNVLMGLLAGLPAVLLRARATAMLQAGGMGRRAALAGSVALGALFVLGGPLLSLMPLPVLGAVMLTVAIGLLDRWSGRLLRGGWRGGLSADLRSGLTVMLLVCGMTLWQGFAAGVTLGVLLSMVIFVMRMNRSPLRSRVTAAQQPSRRIYPKALEDRLAPLRQGIAVWELEGPLFFGNADRLLVEAEALGGDTRVLVLDLRRVASVDETAAAAIGRLGAQLQRRRVDLLLSGLSPDAAPQRALRAFGVHFAQHADLDRAVEAAEQAQLGPAAETTLVARALEQCELMAGLDDEQVAVVRGHLKELRLQAGEWLFRQGDAADGLYVLTLGSVSVIGHDGQATQRYLSLSPGMTIGETALLDGGGRSADAVADTFVALQCLSADALQRLQADRPDIAARLHRNIAVHLSRRLRAASAAWWRGG